MQDVQKIGEAFREFCAENKIVASVCPCVLEDGSIVILTFPNNDRVHPLMYWALASHVHEKMKEFVTKGGAR